MPHSPTHATLWTLNPTHATFWPPHPTLATLPHPTLHSDHPNQHYTLTTPLNTTLWPPQPTLHSDPPTNPCHTDQPNQPMPHSDHPTQHYTLTTPTNPCHTLTTPPNTTLWPPTNPCHTLTTPPNTTLTTPPDPCYTLATRPMLHSGHPTQHYTLTTNQPMPHSDHPTRPMPHSDHPTQHYTLTTPPNTTLWPPQPIHATLWPPHPTLHSDHPIQHLPHFDPFTIQLPCSALTTPLTWGDECGICGATGQDAAQQAEQVVDDLIHARHIRGRIPVRQNCPQQLQGQDLKADRRHSPNWTLFCFFFMRTTQPPCSFPPQFLVLLMLKLTVHLYVFIILRVTIKCSVRY